jgi:hypothetical protein
MEDIKIDVPVCDQYDKAHEESWAYRMCAPCALWMLLKHHDKHFVLTPTHVCKELIAAGGYLENVGFKHAAIAELGQKYGLPLTYAKKFFYNLEEKEVGMKIINDCLKHRRPVIVTMFSHLTPGRGGHMVVVHGFQEFNGKTIGYYLQSSDATFRGHQYFLTLDEFLPNWRGGLIWPE